MKAHLLLAGLVVVFLGTSVVVKAKGYTKTDKKGRFGRWEKNQEKLLANLKEKNPEAYEKALKEYQELKALKEKDPAAFMAKLKELHKKRQKEREARLTKLKETNPEAYAKKMKEIQERNKARAKEALEDMESRLEKIKNRNPEVYADRKKEIEELKELLKKDPVAFKAKMEELRKKAQAWRKAHKGGRKGKKKDTETITE